MLQGLDDPIVWNYRHPDSQAKPNVVCCPWILMAHSLCTCLWMWMSNWMFIQCPVQFIPVITTNYAFNFLSQSIHLLVLPITWSPQRFMTPSSFLSSLAAYHSNIWITSYYPLNQLITQCQIFQKSKLLISMLVSCLITRSTHLKDPTTLYSTSLLWTWSQTLQSPLKLLVRVWYWNGINIALAPYLDSLLLRTIQLSQHFVAYVYCVTCVIFTTLPAGDSAPMWATFQHESGLISSHS